MEKKTYIAPVISYVGPDICGSLEINAPISAAITASTAISVVTGVTIAASTVW